jgi:CubicO group peptidase (beta-lactamase class C family)
VPTTIPTTTLTTVPTTAPTITPTTAPTTTPDNSVLLSTLDIEIERIFQQSSCPGLAVGVVQDYELVYAKGFGVTNLETGEEFTTRTLFHMASVTKPFVATSIVQLFEQEKLSAEKCPFAIISRNSDQREPANSTKATDAASANSS